MSDAGVDSEEEEVDEEVTTPAEKEKEKEVAAAATFRQNRRNAEDAGQGTEATALIATSFTVLDAVASASAPFHWILPRLGGVSSFSMTQLHCHFHFACGLSDFYGLYLVLLGFTEFYWALLSFTGFYLVLLGFT